MPRVTHLLLKNYRIVKGEYINLLNALNVELFIASPRITKY